MTAVAWARDNRAWTTATAAAWTTAWAAQANLLRCLLGNPFRDTQ